ncbi:MAG: radical SAM protein [Lachnospiraceae bacterium]|nr:radical SAM protein [Lachnospiraceae bacterium]
MSGCRLCPRECGADRKGGQKGSCHADDQIRVARAALHFCEEPCISGKKGAGAVFFSGCALGCVYCQNRAISRGEAGLDISVERLSEIFLELQAQGANNINLVTAGHYVPQVCAALRLAKKRGLVVPIVWNSSGYEKAETLRLLEGLADIYLPDLKYLDAELAERYSYAGDYPEVAKKALREMVRQQPRPRFDERGIMTAGVIVRHLLLPGHVREAKRVVSYLYETYGQQIYMSLMNQYTPPDGEYMRDANASCDSKNAQSVVPVRRQRLNCEAAGAEQADPLLMRRVTKREYERLLDHAVRLGVEQAFYQEGETAMESFIPAFDGMGVISH